MQKYNATRIFIGAGAIAVFLSMAYNAAGNSAEQSQRRTFLSIEGSTAFSARRSQMELTLPDGTKRMLEKRGEKFEISPVYIKENGFKFEIQMMRADMRILPCEFTVSQLFSFNRRLICRIKNVEEYSARMPAKVKAKPPPVHESVEVRVFTTAWR